MSDLSSTTAPLLEARKLTKIYPNGQVNAVRDVDLTIHEHEYVALMGASGSGKSTLLNMLGGLSIPTSGEVLFHGRPIGAEGGVDRFRASQVGFVFQSFHLLPTLTALENVQIPMFEMGTRPSRRTQKARELLEAVGMRHRADHLPMRLSVGERQRVAIARSLANDPRVLLADEPTGNLDSRTSEEVLDLFDALHEERGVTLVLVTHSDDVARRAQRIVRFRDGQIVADERVHAGT